MTAEKILIGIMLILTGFFAATVIVESSVTFQAEQLAKCEADLPRSQYCEPVSINFVIVDKK